MNVKAWGTELEQYVTFSSSYPHRIGLPKMSKHELEEIVGLVESQLGYCYLATNPAISAKSMFFESLDDATMAKMVIPGNYVMKEFK